MISHGVECISRLEVEVRHKSRHAREGLTVEGMRGRIEKVGLESRSRDVSRAKHITLLMNAFQMSTCAICNRER
jgi:hypothetical protein